MHTLPIPKPQSCILLLLAVCLMAGARSQAGAALPSTSVSQKAPSVATLAGLPLFFEPSGQGPRESFVARGQNCQVLIEPGCARIFLTKPQVSGSTPSARQMVAAPAGMEVRTIRMELVGANQDASMAGSKAYSGTINDFSGDRSEWRSQIPMWSRVRVAEVYPGVDVIYYGNQQKLEYDFCLEAGVEPSIIALKFTGVDSVQVDSNGELVLKAGEDEVRQQRPVIFQVIDGRRVTVAGGYEILSENLVGFRVEYFRRDLPLTIDPVLSYASYFGGGSGDIALAIRLGSDQSIYVAGQTLSRRFPFTIPAGAFQQSFRGGTGSGDAFVARFDSTGSNLVYFTYLGGGADDGALDLAVDANGNAYVAGFTISENFPTANAISPRLHGKRNQYTGSFPKDGFVAMLNPTGSDLVYSTYVGGSSSDLVTAIAVDPSGTAWITGQTSSTNYPVVNPLPGRHRRSGTHDAFVTAIAPGGGSYSFSTYFGGGRLDAGQGIACDAQGSVYVAGYTASPNFPLTNAFQTNINTAGVVGALDAFLSKFNNQGALLYSSFLGGRANDAAYRVAVDGDGDAYITGYSVSRNFPNTLTNLPGLTNISRPGTLNSDAFLAKVGVSQSGGSELRYSMVLGGSLADAGWDVAVTPAGDAFVTGITRSRNFPASNTSSFLRNTNSGKADVFVFGLRADASQLFYSGYLGGSRADYGYGIAIGPGGEAYLTGRTVSPNFPPVGALQPTRDGANDAFIAVLSPDPVLQTAIAGSAYQLRWWSGIGPEYSVEAAASPAQQDWTPLTSPVTRDGGWRSMRIPLSSEPQFFRLKRQ